MYPPPRRHHPYCAAAHQPYIPSDPAAAVAVAGATVYPRSSATPYSPSQIANPATQFYPPRYSTTQTANPTTRFYPPPYPAVAASPAAATGTSGYPLSTATPYRPPQTVIPTTQFYHPTYPIVSATGTSEFPLSTTANFAAPYRPPQTAIPTTRFRPIPPYSAAVNHPTSHFANRPIPRPDLAAVPISGEYHQRRLRNEAIFLHGLWRQGPPNSNPSSNFAISNPISNFHIKPAPSTTFKKKKKKKKNPVSDIPWPVPPDTTTHPESEAAWPAFVSIPAPSIGFVSEEEKARVFAIRVQKRALNSVQNFFARKYGPESEIDSDEDEDDGSDDHGYLTGIFEGDEDLRSYYENNWRKGEFLCLVCGGCKKKVGKKFKDCVALVQHTITILKTKKRVAHRAYGQVICKLLRWDIHNLPSVADNPSINQQGGDPGKVESARDGVEGAVADAVLSVNENEESDPSKSCSVAGDDVASGNGQAFELPSISEDPGAQQINEANNKSETADGNPAAVHKVPDREL